MITIGRGEVRAATINSAGILLAFRTDRTSSGDAANVSLIGGWIDDSTTVGERETPAG